MEKMLHQVLDQITSSTWILTTTHKDDDPVTWMNLDYDNPDYAYDNPDYTYDRIK